MSKLGGAQRIETKKPDPQCVIKRWKSGYNSSLDFGNPAIPVGPVAFRPPIARSLALSVVNG